MKVLIAHPGTQYSYHLVRQMEKLSYLYRFYTGIAISADGFSGKLIRLLPSFFYKKISNRILDQVTPSKIKTFPMIEFKALFLLKRNRNNSERIFFNRNKKFQLAIPDSAILESDIVVGFDTSSWILAERCKKLGIKFILDVSIPHPLKKARVYEQIALAFPKWGTTLKLKSKELVGLEQKEMELADRLVVASNYTRASLIENNISPEKISINAYGVDAGDFHPISKQREAEEPIQFAFVGLVDARKGVPLLLQVFAELEPSSNATLTLIGPIASDIKVLVEKNYPSVIIKGKVPFGELKKILPLYDVMIFPSFFEGFGLVILEAMACGLVVVSTEATGAPDVIEQGIDGFVFQSGQKEELKGILLKMVKSPGILDQIATMARTKAHTYSWNEYGNRWKSTIVGLC